MQRNLSCQLVPAERSSVASWLWSVLVAYGGCGWLQWLRLDVAVVVSCCCWLLLVVVSVCLLLFVVVCVSLLLLVFVFLFVFVLFVLRW